MNTEVTKVNAKGDRLMSFKEFMFSLFEYAKQKAISIAYHRKESNTVDRAIGDSSLSDRKQQLSPKDSSDDRRLLRKDTSKSIIVDMQHLPARYDRSNSLKSSYDRLKPQHDKDKVQVEVSHMKETYPPKRDSSLDNTIDFFSLLRKHEDINEAGLLRNVENRTKYMLPMMDSYDKPKDVKDSKRDSRTKRSRLGYYIDQGVSSRGDPRAPPTKISRRSNFGCQTNVVGVDAWTMTVAHSQSEQLAEMIKVEAQKTIQMLEMFMQVNKGSLPTGSKPNLNEIHHKTNEDIATMVRNVQTITNDDTESSEDEFGYSYEDNLFEGMDNKYHSVSPYLKHHGQYKDRRIPFSKYVENELKRGKASHSFNTHANRSSEIDDIIRATVNIGSS